MQDPREYAKTLLETNKTLVEINQSLMSTCDRLVDLIEQVQAKSKERARLLVEAEEALEAAKASAAAAYENGLADGTANAKRQIVAEWRSQNKKTTSLFPNFKRDTPDDEQD